MQVDSQCFWKSKMLCIVIYHLSFYNFVRKSKNLKTADSSLLLKHAEEILNLSHEQIKDARQLWKANVFEDG